MSKRTDITGQKKLMNCGMCATVIAYVNANDIDVKFDDGTVVQHKSKNSFDRGMIYNPNAGSCVGEERIMSNGMRATCTLYRNYADIDIEFEDGSVVKHKTKNNFYSGRIMHPYLDSKSILDKTLLMNNGQKATCIADRGSMDIDIQFEDGTVVNHIRRFSFEKGEVKNPNKVNKSFPELVVYECIKKYFPDVVRAYRPSWLINPNTSKRLEIDIWIPSKAVGIEYDGAAWHLNENDRSRAKANIISQSTKIQRLFTILEQGAIAHDSEKHINIFLPCDSNDMPSLIIHLKNAIVQILNYLGIEHPDIDFSQQKLDEIRTRNNNSVLGSVRMMNCGMRAECIAFRSVKDIDVQFEDGEVVYHKQKSSFLNGTISHPSIVTKNVKSSCLGETRMMKCGMVATCIRYHDSNDIDVQFEDGTIVEHRQKNAFILGKISNPCINKKSCVGQIVKMSNGQEAKCIKYVDAKNITIEFEDGTIVEGVSKSEFIKGHIRNPNKTIYSCLGERRQMKSGEYALCIAYRGSQDIDIQFEDGTIVKHRTKQAFYKGETRKNHGESCLGVSKVMSCGMQATCIAYRSALDIDVQFEDGTTVYNKNKANFLKGTIRNPNAHDKRYDMRKEKASCVGKVVLMHNGKKAKCIAYRNANDIDVEFEDGVIVNHRQKSQFLRGGIGYPKLN